MIPRRAPLMLLLATPLALLASAVVTPTARAHEAAEKEPFSVRVQRGDRFFHSLRQTQHLVLRSDDEVLQDTTTRTVREEVQAIRWVDALGQVSEYVVETPLHRMEMTQPAPPTDPSTVPATDPQDAEAAPLRREAPGAYHGAAIVYTLKDGRYQPTPVAGSVPAGLLEQVAKSHAFALEEEHLPVQPLIPEEGWTSSVGKRVQQIIAELDGGAVLSGDYRGVFRTRATAESDEKPIAVLTSAFRVTTRLPVGEAQAIPIALDVAAEVWFDLERSHVRRIAIQVKGTGEQVVDGKTVTAELAAEWSHVIQRVAADWKYPGSPGAASRAESVNPVFDQRPWRLASYNAGPERRTMVYVVDGQTSANWRELVQTRWFGGDRADASAAEFAAKMQEELAASGSTFETVSSDETGVVWKLIPPEDSGPDAVHIVGRVLKGKSGIHTVTYSMRAHHMNDKWAEAWIAALGKARVSE